MVIVSVCVACPVSDQSDCGNKILTKTGGDPVMTVTTRQQRLPCRCCCSFDTSIGGLVLSDQFLQIATYLDSDKVYGLGEHERQHFPHDMNWDKWGMWTRDQAVEVLTRDAAVQGLITKLSDKVCNTARQRATQ